MVSRSAEDEIRPPRRQKIGRVAAEKSCMPRGGALSRLRSRDIGLERAMRPGAYLPLPSQPVATLTVALETQGSPASRRTRELGIRVALGARAGDIRSSAEELGDRERQLGERLRGEGLRGGDDSCPAVRGVPGIGIR